MISTWTQNVKLITAGWGTATGFRVNAAKAAHFRFTASTAALRALRVAFLVRLKCTVGLRVESPPFCPIGLKSDSRALRLLYV